MKAKKLVALTLAMLMASTSLAGCSQSANTSSAAGSKADSTASTAASGTVDKNITATIEVCTNRTDMKTVFDGYSAEFKKTYPNVTIKWTATTDYQGDMTKRMTTEDYGDVLMIPANITKDKFPGYFEALGKQDDIKKEYNYTDNETLDGTTYAIPVGANANGFVYNDAVLKAAGITKLPETADDFSAMLKAIKDKGTAVPLYTNYKDGWPLTNWTNAIVTAMAGDMDYMNKMLTNKSEYLPGSASYASLKLLYDAVKNKYVEKDPITSNWEQSKQDMADGKIGVMCLGTWAVGQIKAKSKTPDDIKFMPAPARKDGKVIMQLGPDYGLAVNKHSKNIALGKEFVKFFVKQYPNDSQMISSLVGAELPAYLKDVQNLTLSEVIPGTTAQSKAQDTIFKESTININDNGWIKTVIESGLGTNKTSFDDYMKAVNAKWVKGIDKASK